MKFFLDTAIRDEIREMTALGMVDGVTTNPSLLKTAAAPYREVIAEICRLVDPGPVGAQEVLAEDADGMLREARALHTIAPNVVVKIPMGPVQLQAVRALRDEQIDCNVTLVFSGNKVRCSPPRRARATSAPSSAGWTTSARREWRSSRRSWRSTATTTSRPR